MFFTREDILKIQNALLQLSIKDSELPNAEPVTYDDTLSIVQDGKNKQIKIEDFLNQISLWKREDFINISDKYDEHYISLIEAIKLVPVLQRKDGLVITFQDIEGNWEIYQFRGNITEFFEENKWFNLYDYRNNIIQSIIPDEEDLTASIPNENGNSLVSLKDRVYNPTSFSGKGYKILRKNIQSVNIASTKITITKAPSTDGTLSFTINDKETQIAVSVSTDNTTALVAQKVAIALQDSMTEYDVSIDASFITLTRKSDDSVTPSVFSANTTGVVCTVTDSTKREFRNILTLDMINQPNTIYEIRYDFDLNGETIELQEGCTFKFDGGSFNNGTIIFNSTYIDGKITNSLNVKSQGKIANKNIYSSWFGSLHQVNIDFSSITFHIDREEEISKPLILDNTTNCVIDGHNYKITVNGVTFIQPQGNFSKIEVKNCVVDGKSTHSSSFFNNYSSDYVHEQIFVHDNYIKKVEIGISLNADLAGDYRNSKVYNNYLEDIDGIEPGSGYGIHLANAEYCDIYNNIIIRCGRHSIYHAWGNHNRIFKNQIINHRETVDFNVRTAIAIYRNSHDIEIDENIIENCFSVGIHVFSSTDEREEDKYNTKKYNNSYNIYIKNNKFITDENHQKKGDETYIMLGYNVHEVYADYVYSQKSVYILNNIFNSKKEVNCISLYACDLVVIENNKFNLDNLSDVFFADTRYRKDCKAKISFNNNSILSEENRVKTALYIPNAKTEDNWQFDVHDNNLVGSRLSESHFFKLYNEEFIESHIGVQTNNVIIRANDMPKKGWFIKGDMVITCNYNNQFAYICMQQGSPGVWWEVLHGMLNANYANVDSFTNFGNLPIGARVNANGIMGVKVGDGIIRNPLNQNVYFKMYGAISDAPQVADMGNPMTIGSTYFATDLGKMVVWNGNKWVNVDGTELA